MWNWNPTENCLTTYHPSFSWCIGGYFITTFRIFVPWPWCRPRDHLGGVLFLISHFWDFIPGYQVGSWILFWGFITWAHLGFLYSHLNGFLYNWFFNLPPPPTLLPLLFWLLHLSYFQEWSLGILLLFLSGNWRSFVS